MKKLLLLTLIGVAGCTLLPPLPGDAQAKRFESIPDRAVIYVARHIHDKHHVAPLQLDGELIGSTYRGTYLRIIVPAGEHRIAGYAGDSGLIRIATEPGKLYFINQSTWGFRSLDGSSFELAEPQYGRNLVLSGTLNIEIIR